VTAYGSRSSQQIMLYFNLGRRENSSDGSAYNFTTVRIVNAGTIKIYLAYQRWVKFRNQLLNQN
jgi:hypothetical protein